MSVIENLRRRDEELASGYIVTRCSKNKPDWSFNPNVRRLGIIAPPSCLSHPDVRQVQDERGLVGGAD